jgi:hypothetical protein
LAGAGCSDAPTGGGGGGGGGGGQAGTVILRLTTPHADDGAVLLEVTGPPIDSAIVVSPSLRLFTRRAGDSTIVGVVVGVVTDGATVTLHVPDVSAAAGYRARVLEVADRRDALRGSLTGYALTVAP